MSSSSRIAAVAAAMGDAARINILMSLRYDGVLTATELAGVANVAPSTTSEHLAKLLASGLVTLQKQGRRRLYTLADGDTCDLIDGLAALAARHQTTGQARSALPTAALHSRLCLDHLAGELGCLVTNALFDRALLRHGADGPQMTPKGTAWLNSIGAGDPSAGDSARCPLRLCHDWSEGAYHLGGGIANSILRAFCQRDWLRVHRGQTAVVLTPKGVSGLRSELGLDLRKTPD